MDVAHGEMVEAELTAFIERRSRQKDPDDESETWQASVRAYEEKRRQNGERTAAPSLGLSRRGARRALPLPQRGRAQPGDEGPLPGQSFEDWKRQVQGG